MKNKVTTIKSPQEITDDKERFDIFLAGSIEQGKAEDWQDKFTDQIKRARTTRNIAIFNPRRDNWNPSWDQSSDNKELVAQIEWELEHLERADLIVMYLQPGTISPISLLELGLYAKEVYAIKKRMIVLCPDGFHRKANVEVVCQWFDISIAKDMDDLIKKTKKEIKDFGPYHEEKMEKLGKELSKIISTKLKRKSNAQPKRKRRNKTGVVKRRAPRS